MMKMIPEIEHFFGYLRFERGCSENTIKAYGSDLRAWLRFCADIGIEPVYTVVAGYLGIEVEELQKQMYKNYMELVNS